MPKKVAFFYSIFNIKMAAQKFATFGKFFMHADMTTVIMQSNKIVFELSWRQLSTPSYRKAQQNLLATPVFLSQLLNLAIVK